MSAPPPSLRRHLATGAAAALVLTTGAVLTVLGVAPAPQSNGLGLVPQTVSLLDQSGVILSSPRGRPEVSMQRAEAVAQRQGSQDGIEQTVLTDARGSAGGPLGTRDQLCWLVLLQANPDPFGNLPAPGQIDVYLVLVSARTGRFIEGLVAFHGPPRTGVGSE